MSEIETPNFDFDTAYHEYEFLAKREREGLGIPESQQRRWELRNDIAEAINDDAIDTTRFQEYACSGRTFNGETVAQISRRLTDGNIFAGRPLREPTLIETVAATKELADVTEEVQEMITPFGIGCFVSGSLTYGRNFLVRADSDVDFVLIVPGNFDFPQELFDLPVFGDSRAELEEVIAYARAHNVDNVAAQPVYKGRKVAINIMKQSTFDSICDFDIETLLQERHRDIKFTKRPGQTSVFTPMYAYDKTERPLYYSEHSFGNGCEFDLPIIEQDELGRIFYGTIIQKLLLTSMFTGDIDYLQSQIARLKQAIVKRLVFEEQNGVLPSGIGRLRDILEKEEFFTRSYRKEVDEEEQALRRI